MSSVDDRSGPITQTPVEQRIHTEPPAPDNNSTPSVHPTSSLTAKPADLHYHHRGPRHQIGDLISPTQLGGSRDYPKPTP
ncbi:hypothetical protein K456DRAFT_51915 [Colletotrichum gloeosporioides 23]|nr:hypothetical protein K456DRAFT_51915 [Colletotrichum gloeosporioides 23]